MAKYARSNCWMRSVSGGAQYVTEDVTEFGNIVSGIQQDTVERYSHKDSSLAFTNGSRSRKAKSAGRNLATKKNMADSGEQWSRYRKDLDLSRQLGYPDKKGAMKSGRSKHVVSVFVIVLVPTFIVLY